RLVYIRRPQAMALQVQTDKKTYGSRQPVKMEVIARTNGNPIQGNFSVSVISEQRVPYKEEDEISILSSFLLSSELRGFIEKPNYYFTNPDEQTDANLDLLTMTQGYSRYAYTETFTGTGPTVNFLPEQGITISGT